MVVNNKTRDTDQVLTSASDSFDLYKKLPVSSRIRFLEKIAVHINNAKSDLVAIARQETGLPEKRLEGEVDRTTGQIMLFVNLLKDGSWVRPVIDTALPDRKPLPKPDIRQMQRPLGVIGVFGASNFPFAFSVAGGDTISALASGCPVVYKVHPGHPQTSEKVSELIIKAAGETGMPESVFSVINGTSIEAGIGLVMHPLLKGLAFTGSFRGGKALFDAAAGRKEPIPVYAEMGSINPVFILPGKLGADDGSLAGILVGSNTLGVGQFCTNPGIIIMIKSSGSELFKETYGKMLGEAAGGKMLTTGIHTSYSEGIGKLKSIPSVALIGLGQSTDPHIEAVPHAFSVSGTEFLNDPQLSEEYFGPSSVIVIADDENQMTEIAKNLSGQLTASVWATEADCTGHEELFRILEEKAGRVMINNVPTGVEVTHAMVHGGPFPATTDSRSTSVGSSAIYRFTRPVCYQNYPQSLLPEELKDKNTLNIWRLINGELTKNSCA